MSNNDQTSDLSTIVSTSTTSLYNSISSPATSTITSNLGYLDSNGTWIPYSPYSPSSTYTTSAFTGTVFNIEIQKTLNLMPLILKITGIKEVNGKIELKFTKYSHKNYSKFLPDYGTILIAGTELYGVYSRKDYYYWEDCLQLEVENIKLAKDTIAKNTLFTTINNFDEHITNEEVTSFLDDYDNYCRYAHVYLESLLSDSVMKSKSSRIEVHNQLETYLR